MKQIGEVECGHGVYIVSGKQIFVGENAPWLFNGKKWSEIKNQSIYVPAVESYAPLATYIINECKSKECNDQIDRFKVDLGNLPTIANPLSVKTSTLP